jgi:thiol-disulfide isomerase/thioredoxin
MANWPAMTATVRPDTPAWLVACLCAGWCRTCDGYREVMEEAARRHPGWRFAWVDIEDHADALDDAKGAADDIETFPTLLVALGEQAHFFGPVLPHAGVLARLLAQAEVGQLPVLTDARVNRMARAVDGLWGEATPGVRVR